VFRQKVFIWVGVKKFETECVTLSQTLEWPEGLFRTIRVTQCAAQTFIPFGKVSLMSRFLPWLAIFLLFSWAIPKSGNAADSKAPPGERIFGLGKVVRFHLAMGEKEFKAMSPAGGAAPFGIPGLVLPRKQAEGTHRNTFGLDLPWSHGDLTFEGETYKDVGVRYKGNYTFIATAKSLKKSLKVDLNKEIDGQKLDGQAMLNLNCGVSDPSRAREALSYRYFRDAGVPAPRTAIAELTLDVPGKYDKEFVGVYTLVEQVGKAFLKRHFKDGKGMLLKPEGLQGGLAYLGTTWKGYEERYKPEGKPTDEQKKRLMDFTRLIHRGNDEDFDRDIGQFLDIEAFLRFIAANALLANLDSYLGFGHNFYLYLVPGTNQFVFIPWDLDLSLATWPAVGIPEQLVELSITHPHAGANKLIDRLFAIKTHQERYMAIIQELVSTSFTAEKLLASLTVLENGLNEPMAKEAKAVAARQETRGTPAFGKGFGDGQFGQSMPPRRFIQKRTESVAAQLAGKTTGFVPKSAGFGIPPARGGPGAPPPPGRPALPGN